MSTTMKDIMRSDCERLDHERSPVKAEGRFLITTITCPFCGTTARVFIRTLRRGCKRCPGCTAIHVSSGFSFRKIP